MTPRWIRRVALLTFAIALIAWPLSGAGTALVESHPIVSPEAIVTLGSHEWERLPAAADLAAATPSALVFLTQPRNPTEKNCHDCAARVARLVAAGVAEARIVTLSTTVSNTREEAAAARAECERRRLRRLTVVTSPYHTRRAWRTFRQAFSGSHVALGMIPTIYSPAQPSRWWRASYDRAYVRYEWAAIAYHYARDAWSGGR